jgi:hypothetical protein
MTLLGGELPQAAQFRSSSTELMHDQPGYLLAANRCPLT